MKRKAFIIIPMLLLLLGLLGPAICAKKVSKSSVPPPVVSGDIVAPVAPGGSNIIQNAASSQPSAEVSSTGAGQKAGGGLNGSGSFPDPEKAGSLLPTAVLQNDSVAINVAVLGKDGEILFGPAPVQVAKKNRWDVTALGALDATGLNYEISTGWSGFVEAVAGQRNKGQAGWMYQVNGEIPLLAADKKPVTAGDKVIWWYSKSMDIPPPNWDQISKRG